MTPHLPHGVTVRGLILTALIGGAGTVFAYAVMGFTAAVRSAWHSKADTSAVNAAVRGLADSLHVIHVQGDSTALRVRQLVCKDRIDQGCR